MFDVWTDGFGGGRCDGGRVSRWVGVAGVVAAMMVTSVTPAAEALVVQPGGSLSQAGPDSAIFGRWGNNAGVVAIAENWVLTTHHQGGSVGTQVSFDHGQYRVAELIQVAGNADLRLARLVDQDGVDAELSTYAAVHTGVGPAVSDTLLMSGFGPQADALVVGGYSTSGTTNNQNSLVLGQNRYRGLVEVGEGSVYEGSQLRVARFDSPFSSQAVDLEATAGVGDSGGGWFIHENDQWELVALTSSISAADEDQPDAFFGQWVYGASVQAHLGAIVTQAYGSYLGDANLDGQVSLLDLDILGRHYNQLGGWEDGDFNGDGEVTLLDLDILGRNYNQGVQGANLLSFSEAWALVVPEPAVGVLAFGLPLIARRRRQVV